jgi:hypothetical protein
MLTLHHHEQDVEPERQNAQAWSFGSLHAHLMVVPNRKSESRFVCVPLRLLCFLLFCSEWLRIYPAKEDRLDTDASVKIRPTPKKAVK